jgi:hypothetical protein
VCLSKFTQVSSHIQYVIIIVAAPAISRQVLKTPIAASTLSMTQPSTGLTIMAENMDGR